MVHLKVFKRIVVWTFLLLVNATLLSAQEQLKISGTVTDENNEAMIGVTVFVQGTQKGTITDANGYYALTVNSGDIITFSYIGYVKQDIPATQSIINATLIEDTQVLEEVVVVGYGVQKKSSVTGAISQVKTEDIENRTITRAEQALQGKTAGVQIVQGSAAPGSKPDVRIRGLSSNTSSTPLYVVDGRIASDIGGIDPNDIESIEVLKDGASTAIYGIAAGNGVVLVTTKKGKAGKGSVAYDFQTYNQHISRIPKVMNAEQYIDYMTEANYLTMEKILENWDFNTNTDWSSAVFESSLMHRHNLSFQGGNDAGTYYLAISYLNNDGYIVGDADKYSRLTATINANYNVKPWLEVGTNNQVEYYKRRTVAEGSEYGSLLMSVLQLDPLTPVTYAPDQLPDHMERELAAGRKFYQDGDGNYYSTSAFQISDQYNPFIMRDKSYSIGKGYNVSGTVFGNLKPIKDLVITSRFGYSLSGISNYAYNQRFYANASIRQDYNQVVASAYVPVSYQWENFANYTKTIEKHHLNAMLGTSIRQSVNFNVNGTIQGATREDGTTELGFLEEDPIFAYFGYATAGAKRTLFGGEETKTPAWFSMFGRVSYDYNDKYHAQISLRRDGADLATLPKEKRYGYFPAVSLGWTVTREAFANRLTFLKLRASWGQNGSASSLGSFMWRPVIQSRGLYPFTEDFVYTTAYGPNVLGNNELTWEKSEQLDLGFDARFFRDRLTLSFDYFDKETKDLIVTGVTLSTIVGNGASPINAGTIENKGIEIELGWQNNTNYGLHYSIKGNFASLHNEVISIHESLARINGASFHTTQGVTVFEPGYPAWYLRGLQLDYIDEETGNPVFKDITPDGVINDDDKTKIGKPMPDFTFGITANLAYKGIDFMIFGTGAYGNDIMMCFNRGDRLQSNMLKMFYDERWTPENKTAEGPRPGAMDIERYWLSDAMVYNGSFFKIKQIQLGYTLPKAWLDKISLSNVRIYGSLDDYFTFTKYPGFDPETMGVGSGMGLDKGYYPSSKKIVFGLNITL